MCDAPPLDSWHYNFAVSTCRQMIVEILVRVWTIHVFFCTTIFKNSGTQLEKLSAITIAWESTTEGWKVMTSTSKAATRLQSSEISFINLNINKRIYLYCIIGWLYWHLTCFALPLAWTTILHCIPFMYKSKRKRITTHRGRESLVLFYRHTKTKVRSFTKAKVRSF